MPICPACEHEAEGTEWFDHPTFNNRTKATSDRWSERETHQFTLVVCPNCEVVLGGGYSMKAFAYPE